MRTWTPGDLVMEGIDLKTVATTTSGIKIPVSEFFQFSLHVLVTLAAGTPTTGLASLGVNPFTGAAGATALVPVIGVSSMNTKVADGEIWTFGGAGAAVGPTGTLEPESDTLKVLEWIQVFLDVTEAVDVVATATADVYLQAEGYTR